MSRGRDWVRKELVEKSIQLREASERGMSRQTCTKKRFDWMRKGSLDVITCTLSFWLRVYCAFYSFFLRFSFGFCWLLVVSHACSCHFASYSYFSDYVFIANWPIQRSYRPSTTASPLPYLTTTPPSPPVSLHPLASSRPIAARPSSRARRHQAGNELMMSTWSINLIIICKLFFLPYASMPMHVSYSIIFVSYVCFDLAGLLRVSDDGRAMARLWRTFMDA